MGNSAGKETKQYGIPIRKINYDDCDPTETHNIKLKGAKAKVDRVIINGLARTKDDIVKETVKDLFTATDFEDVLAKVHKTKTKLEALGCFRNIAIYIDTSVGPKATPNGLEVTYTVKEFKRIVGGVNTQVGDNEGFLTIGLTAPNLNGRGEQIQAHYSFGSKKTDKCILSLVKPFAGVRNPILSGSFYQTTSEWPTSSYKDMNRGFLLDLGINSFCCIRHNLQWEAVVRDIAVISKASSFDVREEAGLNLKSALRHILTIDKRDNCIFPSCGSLVQFQTEFAGLGGNVGFIKNEAFIQSNVPIMNNVVLQGSLAGGFLHRLGGEWDLSISDMFYLGGPLTLRGFSTRGVGPRSEGDTLGSCWYWAAGFHLYTPMPFIGTGTLSEVVRTHTFFNVGNIGDYVSGEDNTERFKENIRSSVGAGLAIRLGQMARVELNLCYPTQFTEADLQKAGYQFGIGIQFL